MPQLAARVLAAGTVDVTVMVGDAVDVHTHPVDILIARVVRLDGAARHAEGAPDQGDVRRHLVHHAGDDAPLLFVQLRVARVRLPGPVHLRGIAQEYRHTRLPGGLRPAAQVLVIRDRPEALVWLPGYLRRRAPLAELRDPTMRERRAVADIPQVGGVFPSGEALEGVDAAPAVAVQVDVRADITPPGGLPGGQRRRLELAGDDTQNGKQSGGREHQYPSLGGPAIADTSDYSQPPNRLSTPTDKAHSVTQGVGFG